MSGKIAEGVNRGFEAHWSGVECFSFQPFPQFIRYHTHSDICQFNSHFPAEPEAPSITGVICSKFCVTRWSSDTVHGSSFRLHPLTLEGASSALRCQHAVDCSLQMRCMSSVLISVMLAGRTRRRGGLRRDCSVTSVTCSTCTTLTTVQCRRRQVVQCQRIISRLTPLVDRTATYVKVTSVQSLYCHMMHCATFVFLHSTSWTRYSLWYHIVRRYDMTQYGMNACLRSFWVTS